ncbi:hypothetical protein MRB53_036217 [Persea americana]|uniref:Uncharacterized protein n=1 Tax=Persea americana TaxID=3435 RepID=A0ACC2K6W9_PERAE|nr:hypothetical protein MRB53_036217 [Persea americana]
MSLLFSATRDPDSFDLLVVFCDASLGRTCSSVAIYSNQGPDLLLPTAPTFFVFPFCNMIPNHKHAATCVAHLVIVSLCNKNRALPFSFF